MNDPQHFTPMNGRGHRRRKVVNMPAGDRYGMDPYEVRALELVGEIDRWLRADQDREARRVRAQFDALTEGWDGGDPGE
ncbi:hypothetical protein Ade02nite_18950 [Paractinoplanes deccanensis]|uniref:Uncharacterized protein n=1 Tax=Paractinoplanes deccanensis TaxID=113561 RepID=A0ABQ3XZT1_9ACTN|nr:hypothetical protein [Actinoplanes deccanensis]GID73254.1 hypothetical protein Ade02nite_18950 [Actinoplanes deccanensis]